MKGISDFTAELSCGTAPQVIFAKQGDEDTRFIRVRFLFGGRDFPTDDVSHSEIRVKKPDGKITVEDGVKETDGSITFPLSAQSLTAAGEGALDLILYDASGKVISTVPARLMVTAAPVGDEAMDSISEYHAFVEQMNVQRTDIDNAQKDIRGLKSDLQSVKSDLSGVHGSISELEDMLGGMRFKKLTQAEYDNMSEKSESTLYTAVDAENEKVKQYLGNIELKSGNGYLGMGTAVALTSGITQSACGTVREVSE